eukprot:TRINITY_DN246_c0_g1_i2.p1 TRINITY_DN246_c0_g1~~TRINITY_DN246_c0_g1_i2.p1  ORF type:complete len:1122 (+),score=463.49 TRINITY_DN246_c0_g1_i2:103-3366(+)
MSTKAVREYDGKRLLSEWLSTRGAGWQARQVLITPTTDLDSLPAAHPWLLSSRLVAKPDQLIKRRGKGGLLLLNAEWADAAAWIRERMGKPVTVETLTAPLDHFLVEPFVPHDQRDEVYLCIMSHRGGEEILFHHEGGVDVGDVDAKATRLAIPVGTELDTAEVASRLLAKVADPAQKQAITAFIRELYSMYCKMHFAYLEINPLVVREGKCFPLDMAAKIDETAAFECEQLWGKIEFPAPFGRVPHPEEEFIHSLDAKTGASLKLTILNPEGRVWLMVAGGGASVVYADTVAAYGHANELANYGEYSGAPSETLTYEYAKTIMRLMTARPDPQGRGKVLIIGGGIANFTDVAATFKGIARALQDYRQQLINVGAKIWVRRAGPNWQQGLKQIRDTGRQLELDISVHGPETHMTSVVAYALGVREIPLASQPPPSPHQTPISPTCTPPDSSLMMPPAADRGCDFGMAAPVEGAQGLFNHSTRAVVYGMQLQAVQQMLDFDFLCKREKPSVACIVFPFSGDHAQRAYFGTREILVPVYRKLADALRAHPDVSVMVNFASFRSAYGATMEALEHSGQINTVAVIAEGIPERYTRLLIKEAERRRVRLIGPATVGGLQPGCFRIGNTGGAIENILMCKLYRPGSVAYVSRSGGMSNELNNIISRNTNGVYEGMAIGGDRYPGTTFIDVLLRYQEDPAVKMMVLLGEVGGVDEHEVCQAVRDGRLTKPLVAWCIGTCATAFSYEVQFGHAGALARSNLETAAAKNQAMKDAGIVVPDSFDQFDQAIQSTFRALVEAGTVVCLPEPEAPQVPMDYSWAKKLGLIRKPAGFLSSIVDDRGEEVMYAGMPISKVFQEDLGVGGVLSLLWFRRGLPAYATKFIEMILMVTADHGPAVSGAHNTIVTARAGKDLVSSLCSGLLTIGPRFGGALDEAALMFSEAFDSGVSAEDFVVNMKRQNKLIMGIGHKVKSLHNPDMRVTIIKEFARAHFPSTQLLDFALQVEQVTTKKKANLILNVDGAIAAAFVDLVRSCGAFTRQEADEAISNGCLNGLFVLGRTCGFIGHFLDQRRLKQGLYRHPTDDINYLSEFAGDVA